jgi:hypothetical protein
MSFGWLAVAALPKWDRGVGHSFGLLDRVEATIEDGRVPGRLSAESET